MNNFNIPTQSYTGGNQINKGPTPIDTFNKALIDIRDRLDKATHRVNTIADQLIGSEPGKEPISDEGDTITAKFGSVAQALLRLESAVRRLDQG